MTFKEWLDQSGLTMCTVAKLSGLARSTMRSIIDGTPPTLTTIKCLVNATKCMRVPIKREMFPTYKPKKSIVLPPCGCDECKRKILDERRNTP